MKVKQLMEILSGFDEDMEVGFEHPSHDYWRSVLITEVDNVEEGYANYSEYHRQLAVPTEDEINEALECQDTEEDFPKDKRVHKMVIIK
jgi:hypothetical protein